MNWEAFGSIAELAGAIAVVASLFYVGRQVRENSRATSGQTYESISARLNDMGAYTFNDPELLDICIRGVFAGDLEESEVYRLTGFIHNLFRILESAFHQYELGFIERHQLKALFHSSSLYFASAYGQQMWESRRDLHGEAFQEFVDSLIDGVDPDRVFKGFGLEK